MKNIKMKIAIKKRDKKIDLKVEKANKLKGLMFRRNNQAILFEFNKPTRQAIHSFFCKPFLAVWLDKDEEILETKIIKTWKFSIKPRKKFSKLIEIPLSNYKIVNFIVDK